MLFKYAKRLCNQDQVKVKATGELVKVLKVKVLENNVFVFAMTRDGYTKLHHKEIL